MKNRIYNEFPIQTKDLYINKIELDELLKIKNNTTQSEKYRITCRPIKQRDSLEQKSYYENILNGSCVILSIKRKYDNVLIGDICFSDYNERNKSIEMGYYLMHEFRGNKYMSEAISSVLEVFFNKNMLNKVYAQTGSFNKSSINTLRSIGFEQDATLRNHHEIDGVFYDDYIFSILREEFEIRRLNMRKEIDASKTFWNDYFKDKKAEVLKQEDFNIKDEMKPIFNKFIKECDIILDYGFGGGEILACVAKSGQVKKCYGIDNGSDIVSYVNELIKCNNFEDKIKIFDGGLNALSNFEDSSIDGIIISNVLDVVTKDAADSIVNGLLRILKPNGLMMLKLNQDCTHEQFIKMGMVNFSGNLYARDGVMRARSCSTKQWRNYLSQYFIEEMYSDVPYQTDNFYDRLFLLRKK